MATEKTAFINPQTNRMTLDQILTKEDLRLFKEELIEDFKSILGTSKPLTKKWLKSAEVRELLNISPGTLQNFRVNGTLTFTKIGGILYYNQDDIQKVLEQNQIH